MAQTRYFKRWPVVCLGLLLGCTGRTAFAQVATVNGGVPSAPCCTPNVANYGYFRTWWRAWPNEPRPDKTFPQAVPATAIPTPPPEPILPPALAPAPNKPAAPAPSLEKPQEKFSPKDGTKRPPNGQETLPLPEPVLPDKRAGSSPATPGPGNPKTAPAAQGMPPGPAKTGTPFQDEPPVQPPADSHKENQGPKPSAAFFDTYKKDGSGVGMYRPSGPVPVMGLPDGKEPLGGMIEAPPVSERGMASTASRQPWTPQRALASVNPLPEVRQDGGRVSPRLETGLGETGPHLGDDVRPPVAATASAKMAREPAYQDPIRPWAEPRPWQPRPRIRRRRRPA